MKLKNFDPDSLIHVPSEELRKHYETLEEEASKCGRFLRFWQDVKKLIEPESCETKLIQFDLLDLTKVKKPQ